HRRPPAASALNCSKDFPGPGITFTVGPVGVVTHPAHSSIADPTAIRRLVMSRASLEMDPRLETEGVAHVLTRSMRDADPQEGRRPGRVSSSDLRGEPRAAG